MEIKRLGEIIKQLSMHVDLCEDFIPYVTNQELLDMAVELAKLRGCQVFNGNGVEA